MRRRVGTSVSGQAGLRREAAEICEALERRKGAGGTIWGKLLCAEDQTGDKQAYTLSRPEAKNNSGLQA